MVEFVEDRPQGVFHGEEIGDAGSSIEWAGDLGGDAIIMAVERLADAAFQKDEVGRAEDQSVAADTNPMLHTTRNLLVILGSGGNIGDICFSPVSSDRAAKTPATRNEVYYIATNWRYMLCPRLAARGYRSH